MRVQLIKESNLRLKALDLTGAKDSFDDFIRRIKIADWETPNDIKNTFSSADIIGESRVVFNLKGNQYRLICKYHFITDIKNKWAALYVAFVGTHDEYDELCDPSSDPTQFTVWDFK